MVAKADKRKQKIYHIFIGVITVLFIGNFILQDKNAKDDNLKRYYSGTIQNIVIIDGFKGVNLKINGSWYNLSYTKDFENINYIGCKIEKKLTSQVFGLRAKKGQTILFIIMLVPA